MKNLLIRMLILAFMTVTSAWAVQEGVNLKGLGTVTVQAVALSRDNRTVLITTRLADQEPRYEIVAQDSELRNDYRVSRITTDSIELEHVPSKSFTTLRFSTAPVTPENLKEGQIELYCQHTPVYQILFLLAENSGLNLIFTDDIGGDFQRDWVVRDSKDFFEKFAQNHGCRALFDELQKIWFLGKYSSISKIRKSRNTVDSRIKKDLSRNSLTYTARNTSLNYAIKEICRLNRIQVKFKKVTNAKVSMKILNLDYLEVLNYLSDMYDLKLVGPVLEIDSSKN